MSRRIVLISFTTLDANGGVPRWNRDMVSAFPDREVVHYSFDDVIPALGIISNGMTLAEWDCARTLNAWLVWSKRIGPDDIIFVDGFWGLGLELHPNVVQIAHGNWSHTTKDDVEAGILPEFPLHHAQQVTYRKAHQKRGGRTVAVSNFIADQCKLQWDLDYPVINNGVDLDEWNPKHRFPATGTKRLIVHGVTNANKGFEHIAAVKTAFPDDDVLSLDEAAAKFKMTKPQVLASADLAVIPSAHEGNSFFCAECLASDLPIVCYDVGFPYAIKTGPFIESIGVIIDRRRRSPEETVRATRWILQDPPPRINRIPRKVAERYLSLDRFKQEWRAYIEREFPE